MTDLHDANYHLLFDRETLFEALKTLAADLEPSVHWISISYKDGKSRITAGVSSSVIPATGHWDGTIFVDAEWVRLMATLLPDINPLSLRIKNGRFYTNTYSQSCRLSLPRRTDTRNKLSAKNRETRISKAAALLGDFRVTERSLETLVNSIRAQREPLWQPEEKAMIAAVAKAWTQLAPLGVETSDLRTFLDEAIRYAFVRNKE
jgi:hypothetical protein